MRGRNCATNSLLVGIVIVIGVGILLALFSLQFSPPDSSWVSLTGIVLIISAACTLVVWLIVQTINRRAISTSPFKANYSEEKEISQEFIALRPKRGKFAGSKKQNLIADQYL